MDRYARGFVSVRLVDEMPLFKQKVTADHLGFELVKIIFNKARESEDTKNVLELSSSTGLDAQHVYKELLYLTAFSVSFGLATSLSLSSIPSMREAISKAYVRHLQQAADSDEENRSFRADDDQIIAERRCREYCGAGDRHGSRKTFGIQSTSFRFCIWRGRCLRKICLSTPLTLHLPHSHRQIPPIIQWHFHGSDLLEEADEVLQTGDRSTARLIE